jgi:TP901 family phage tail tape measure protein
MMSEGDSVVEQLILAIEAAGFPEATAAVEGLTEATEALTAATDDAAASMGGATAAGSGSKGKGLFGRLSSIKTLMAGLFVGESLKQFSDFQSQMERLRTQTGATQGEVGRMSKGILDMATSVGTGPNSLAKSLYHLESAGFRGKEALDALRTSAQGAKIGGADLTDTTTAMTAVMVAGFRGVHTLKQAMGQLNATVGAGDMTMQDLNDALGTGLLSTLKTLGLQVNDAGAALAVLGDNNIRGAQAATRLRMGLMQLVHPSETAQKAMHGLGLAPLKLAEDLRKPNGLLVMLQDLKGRLRDLSPTQQASDLASIFGGGRNSAAMLTLVNQMDRLKSKYGEVAKGGRDFNSDWKATTHTLAFFGDQLKALGEVALIKVGAGLAWVVEKVKGLVSGFEKGKLGAELLGASLAGLVAGFVAFKLVSGVVSAVESLTAAMAALDVAMDANPVGAIIVGLVALGAAMAVLVLKVKPVRQAFVETWSWVKDHWKLLLAILLGPIGLATDFIVAHFHEIVDVVKWVVGAVKTVWKALTAMFGAPFKALWSVVKTVAVAIVHAISWAVSQIEHLLSKILGPLKSVAHFAGGLIGGGLHALGDVGHFMGLASGTPQVTHGGAFMVGERGPELVYLPRGAAVQPNEGGLASALKDALAPLAGMGGDQKIDLVVDGRVLAQTVVRQGLMSQSAR